MATGGKGEAKVKGGGGGVRGVEQMVVGVYFNSFFISAVVKFIYRLSILCFVSLLYAQGQGDHKLHLGVSKKKKKKGSASYFLSSLDADTLKDGGILWKLKRFTYNKLQNI